MTLPGQLNTLSRYSRFVVFENVTGEKGEVGVYRCQLGVDYLKAYYTPLLS